MDFVHVLLFECPNCGRPMQYLSIDQAPIWPDADSNTKPLDVECFGDDCHWRGTCIAVTKKRGWSVPWPHLKPSSAYTKRTTPHG
jgi:hypothetical protein